MMPGRPVILVVDDKRNMVRLMAKVLKDDAVVRTAETGAAALKILESEAVDAVLCDLKMPDMDGLEVLKACRKSRPRAEFVLMTAYATVGTAVEALRLGAYDYLMKPFEPEAARTVLLRALARVSLQEPGRADDDNVLPGVIARSQVMRDLAVYVRRLAASETTALILGETGTGKERIARAIHELSPRAGRRFVALNCAAIPVELLESEMFGHSKGAFTGAMSERKGLFEEASGGSLFLDEIGDMRPSLQAKLTRALEERSVRRIGEAVERPIDVRLIAATHQNLEGMVRAGAFREDLWYRLNVAAVRVPPLRERPDDIEVLACHFLRQLAEGARAPRFTGFAPGALGVMKAYGWPGNVRQLRSAVEHAGVVATGLEITAHDLPAELARGATDTSGDIAAATWSEALERGRIETGRRYLEAVLRRYDGDVAAAAAHAGVERESFYRLMRKCGVEPSAFRAPPAAAGERKL